MLAEFWHNFTHNLFKPLLLFFYMGFMVPILGIQLEFPHVLYQAITIYLLVAIGWHGGEELASLSSGGFGQALGFMAVGFVTNFCVGILAYKILRHFTRLREVDAATVAGYYGSDSAGTFVTCVGVLTAASIPFAAYMPVLLAVMEVPGCLVALYLVNQLREQGMDRHGNMPGEIGYSLSTEAEAEALSGHAHAGKHRAAAGHGEHGGGVAVLDRESTHEYSHDHEENGNGNGNGTGNHRTNGNGRGLQALLNRKTLHEIFLNPGLYLLFGGIAIGFISRLQGAKVTAKDDELFLRLFEGVLCLFLLEMGMTACKRLRDLRHAGVRFILFGLLAPNVFATVGICIAHGYSMVLGEPFDIGTYALFAVLCGAASYIAVPAVQRLAIPEASPTLPLAASLGLTFSYNVTIGIPVYIMIATALTTWFPVAA